MRVGFIVAIIILIVLSLLMLIYLCISSKKNISNHVCDEVDLDFFGRDLLKELDYKSGQEEIEIANQVIEYAREVP